MMKLKSPVFLGLALFASCVLVENQMNEYISGRGRFLLLSIVTLGILLSLSTGKLLDSFRFSVQPTRDLPILTRWIPHFCSVFFALASGKTVFINRFLQDEIGYFSTIQQNFFWNFRSIFIPLNEHFLPLLKLLLWGIYNLFGIHYFGISLLGFFLFILSVHCLFLLFTQAKIGSWIALTVTAAYAVWSGFLQVLSWKSAGVPLIFPVSFFLLWMSKVQTDITNQTKTPPYLLVGVLNFVTVFSSSLITLPGIYLAPLFLKTFRSKSGLFRLGLTLLISLIISGLYFYLRNSYFGIPFTPNIHLPLLPYFHMIQSFLVVQVLNGIQFAGYGIGGFGFFLSIFLALVALKSVWDASQGNQTGLEPSGSDPSTLILLGFLIFHLTLIQVGMGRGQVLDQPGGTRYYYFSTIGFLLMLAGALEFGRTHLKSMLSKNWQLFAKLGFATLWVLFTINHLFHRELHTDEVNRSVEIQKVRSEFFQDLETMLCAADRAFSYPHSQQVRLAYLPDFPFEKCAIHSEFGVGPPFDMKQYGFTLEFYARFLLSSCHNTNLVRFAPAEWIPEDQLEQVYSIPQIAAFYKKYFSSSQKPFPND